MAYKLGDLVYCIAGPYNWETTLEIVGHNNPGGDIDKASRLQVKVVFLSPEDKYNKHNDWMKEEWLYPISDRLDLM